MVVANTLAYYHTTVRSYIVKVPGLIIVGKASSQPYSGVPENYSTHESNSLIHKH
jgi:hypothetical protein